MFMIYQFFFHPVARHFVALSMVLVATFMYESTQTIISISGSKEFASSENEFHISVKLILMVMLALMLMSSPFSLNIIAVMLPFIFMLMSLVNTRFLCMDIFLYSSRENEIDHSDIEHHTHEQRPPKVCQVLP